MKYAAVVRLYLLIAIIMLIGCASSIVHGEKYKTNPIDTKAKAINDNIDLYFIGQTPSAKYIIIGKVLARAYVLEKGMEELKIQARELGGDAIIEVKYERKFSVDYLQDLFDINGDAIIYIK